MMNKAVCAECTLDNKRIWLPSSVFSLSLFISLSTLSLSLIFCLVTRFNCRILILPLSSFSLLHTLRLHIITKTHTLSGRLPERSSGCTSHRSRKYVSIAPISFVALIVVFFILKAKKYRKNSFKKKKTARAYWLQQNLVQDWLANSKLVRFILFSESWKTFFFLLKINSLLLYFHI